MAVDLHAPSKSAVGLRRSVLDVARPRRLNVELWEMPGDASQLGGRFSGSAHIAWPELLAEVIVGFLAYYARLDQASLSLLRDVASLERRVQQQAKAPTMSQAAVHEVSPGWILETPLLATIESYDEHVIAQLPELNAYGEGDTEVEALADLRHNIVELRDALEELEPGTDLAGRWKRLVRPAEAAAP